MGNNDDLQFRDKVSVARQLLTNIHACYLDLQPLAERSTRVLYANDNSFRALPNNIVSNITKESQRIAKTFRFDDSAFLKEFIIARYHVYNIDGFRAAIWVYRCIVSLRTRGLDPGDKFGEIMNSCRSSLLGAVDVFPNLVTQNPRLFVFYNDFNTIANYIYENHKNEVEEIASDAELNLKKIISIK